ncbi:MAG: DoxX family protein [Deltaproteobacteria bacterium]|nr:DoxX family protein [Deltaproteobacteria bacterium]
MKTVRTLFRVIVGIVFIFSGFVKGIDPLGTVYRMQDYFLAFGTTWANDLALPLTIFLCVLEFILGVSLLFNLWIRKSVWAMLPMMTFFTILTFFDAFYNLVPDCGCFGDAIMMTNTETFIKNIVLMAMVIPIFLWRKKFKSTLKPAVDLVVLIAVTILFTGLSFYCLWHLPIIDFREWKKGAQVNERGDSSVHFYVTYKNRYSGETEEFLAPNYPWNDSTWLADWIFVSQRVEDPNQDEMTLMIEDTLGNDLAQSYLDIPDYHFFVVAYSLDDANLDALIRLQPLYLAANDAGYSFIGLTTTVPEKIAAFQTETGVGFAFYNSDDAVLKSMIRSNPGLILLKDGVVIKKWHYNDFPEWEEVREKYIDN